MSFPISRRHIGDGNDGKKWPGWTCGGRRLEHDREGLHCFGVREGEDREGRTGTQQSTILRSSFKFNHWWRVLNLPCRLACETRSSRVHYPWVEWSSSKIGFEGCSGTASSCSIDPRPPTRAGTAPCGVTIEIPPECPTRALPLKSPGTPLPRRSGGEATRLGPNFCQVGRTGLAPPPCRGLASHVPRLTEGCVQREYTPRLIEDRRSFGPGGLAKEERHPASICPSHSSLVSLPPADGAARPSDSQGGDAAASLRPTQLRPGGPREEETRGGGRSVVPSTSDSCAHFSTHPHRPPGDGAARPPGSLCRHSRPVPVPVLVVLPGPAGGGGRTVAQVAPPP
ncbi:hypothetical protein THAOC_23677, partial [Thalassiosira oceanica]